ncbi:MAG: hypothetical protein Kow0042_16950 [Calditrichia bacterium]
MKLKTEGVFIQSPDNNRDVDSVRVEAILEQYPLIRADRIMAKPIYQKNPEWAKYYLMQAADRQNVSGLIEALNQDPAIEWAEPNYVFPVHAFPNDSLFPQQWALQKIGVIPAWEIEQGRSEVIVGIIDTGVDYFHQDLQGQFWVNTPEDLNGNGIFDPADNNGIDDDGNGYVDDVIGWDFTDAPNFPDHGDYLNPDNDPMDEYTGGHGTAVAGIIAAATDNITGIAGIAPHIRIMALRAGTALGYLEEDDIAEAIVYAVQNGCRIINMSFGDVVYSHLIKDAVVYGSSRGVLFVASAGNSGNNTLQYPASYDETISVGATDKLNNLAPFSSFGSKIDLVAPGQEVLTLSPQDEYGSFSGTSFSAPMVSAALALICSHDLTLTPDGIRSALLSGCQDLGFAGWDSYFGHGLVNVYHSLVTTEPGWAKIEWPASLSGVKTSTVPILGTAISTDLRKYVLSYGVGESPLEFIPFHENNQQVVNDTLGFWHTGGLTDSVYNLELKIHTLHFQEFVHRVIVYLDRTPPRVDSMRVTPLIIDNYHGALVEVYTDDPTTARFHFRRLGEADFPHTLSSEYFDKQHAFVISKKDIHGIIEYYLEFTNPSGLTHIEDNGQQFYRLSLNQPNSFTSDFSMIFQTPGFGYFLPFSTDFNFDGSRDLVAYAAWPDQPEPRISILSYHNGEFQRYVSTVQAFPRDVLDIDGDSRPELLAGYGGQSMLFPGNSLPDFSSPPVQAYENDFWAGRLRDLDSDGRIELLAIHDNAWHIYKITDPVSFTVTSQQILDNPSSGENNYGVPYCEIKDLDADGDPEIVIGDYDGDLIIYEKDFSGQYVPLDMIHLGGIDATYRMASGDFDGDNRPELVVATQRRADYIGESIVDRQYWILTILKLNPSLRLEVVWRQQFYTVADNKGIFSGVTAGDYDGDGLDEIFFTPYPKCYFIQFENNEYQPTWFYQGVNSHSVPAIESNRFLLVGDSTLMVWETLPMNQRPMPPASLTIFSADTSHVTFGWDSIPQADFYRIKRTHLDSQSTTFFQHFSAIFTDSTVDSNQLYEYQVMTVDSSFPDPLSSFSAAIRVRTETAPELQKLELVNDSQLLLQFTKPLGNGSYQPNQFYVSPGVIRPKSAVRGGQRTRILLTFPNRFDPGDYELFLFRLENRYAVPFYTDTLVLPFTVEPSRLNPYVRSVEILSKDHLRIYFSHPMKTSSAETVSNYELEPDGEILQAQQDPVDQTIVNLYLSRKNRIGSLGVKYYLTIKKMQDIYGNFIDDKLGNRFLLQQIQHDLDHLVVFPNPCDVRRTDHKITFGNLPRDCEIIIFSANGRRVVLLREEDNDGGVSWNLKNEAGEEVGSGVYIYIARYLDQEKIGKFVVIQ